MDNKSVLKKTLLLMYIRQFRNLSYDIEKKNYLTLLITIDLGYVQNHHNSTFLQNMKF